jgi:hypothetical protein
LPYIPQEQRDNVRNGLHPYTAGQLNYVITLAVKRYLAEQGYDYRAYNEVVGVLECAKLELYRRSVAPYEDEKIKENGDVYSDLG